MNIDDLSGKTGLHRDTISNIINNKTASSYSTINAIFYALHLTLEEGRNIFLAQVYVKRKLSKLRRIL